MGQHQRALGLNVLPVAEGGRTVETYMTGQSYLTGRADLDPVVLEGIKRDLGIRSFMISPLSVAGTRRGVLGIATYEPDRYSQQDLHYLEAVAHWVGAVIQRVELVEQRQAELKARARQVVAEELLTFLAHDLKNYMMPIAMRVVVMRDQAQREARDTEVQTLDEIRQALVHLRALIDSLLDAARLEQGVFALHFEEVDVCRLLLETMEALDPGGGHSTVNAPPSLTTFVDPVRVQTLLANLLSNALKYSPPGKQVRVNVLQSGEWVHITVEDEGSGITPDVLPRLFERFAAGHHAPGLGIGLYMAKRIAEAHGGTLDVDGRSKTGTRFELKLPATSTDI
jgi:signal transduction histidine kinase